MADLISRSALMAHFKQDEWGTPDERWRPEREFGRMVLNATAVDAQQIIRCENCWYYDDIEDAEKPGYRECHYFSNWAAAHYMLPEDFCSCAKRKDEVEE